MIKNLFTILLVFCISAFSYGATIRIEDASTISTGYCGADGSRQNSYTGADNGFYINLSNSSAKGINWKVSIGAAGTYSLKWRYANGGSSSATTAKVLVDGATAVSSVSFPRTSSWTTWTTATVSVNLSAGVHTIRLETTVASEFANIDWIEVTGTSPAAASCSGTTPPPPTTYSLSVSSVPSNGGSVSVNPSGSSFASGTVVTLTATPASGFKFDGWSGGASGTSATTTVTMNANKTVAAAFSQVSSSQFTLTTSTSGSGSVGVSPAGGVYNSGVVVTLTATPASGWKFSGWSGAASGTSISTTVTMNANKSVTATFTTTTTPPPPVNNGIVGFATLNGGTKGGQGGASRTISTLADLQSWVTSREKNTTPEIVYISGRIASSSTVLLTIKNGANISILGLGSTAELQNVGLNIRDYNNVIVRNIKIHEVFYPDDALTIDNCQNVWVDHCELHSKRGPGITVDTYDGLLDIKKGSKFVTISWCYIHDHMKTSLIGHSDNSGQQAMDSQIRVTYHHNYFYNTSGRNPSLRFGAVHLFNNYFRNIDDYGIAVRQGAHALIENNVYENVIIPITTNKFDGPEGFACQRGNLFPGSGANSITQTGCEWWNSSTLPYSYTLDAVSSVTSNVPANVGVGKVNVSGQRTIASAEFSEAAGLKVSQNYPNPVDGSTTIGVWLKEAGNVKINLYTTSGSKVAVIADRKMDKGLNEVRFENNGLKSGIYIYQVEAAKGLLKRKMIVK